MTDLEHGWIATGPDVPPSCELAEPEPQTRECAHCGGIKQVYMRDYDGSQFCIKAGCLTACMESRTHDLANALQNVLDGVHGAKDAAKTLLAKWRVQ